MAAYVIYQGEVLDPVRYDEYKTKGEASILAAGGKYIVRGGEVEVLEGEPPAGRTVVLSFRHDKLRSSGIEAPSTPRPARSGKVPPASLVCTSSTATAKEATGHAQI
jgi:uncharacterized protein (DUF1330 family)